MDESRPSPVPPTGVHLFPSDQFLSTYHYRMTVYVSGPMTGIENHNYPLFNAVAQRLRWHGLRVVNPAELDAVDDPDQEWGYYIRRDIKALADCTHIVMLPGWHDSKGANLELSIAHALGMGVTKLSDTEVTNLLAVPHG